MNRIMLFGGAALAVSFLAWPAIADPVNVVSGENFYGDIAKR